MSVAWKTEEDEEGVIEIGVYASDQFFIELPELLDKYAKIEKPNVGIFGAVYV